MTVRPIDSPTDQSLESFPWSILAGSVLVTFCGYYTWIYTFTNFAIGELAAGPQEIGITRALTSIPGILAFAIGGLLFILSAAQTFIVSFVLLGAGLIIVGVSSNWVGAAAGAVAIGFGQVTLYTLTNRVGIFRSGISQTPISLGRLKSYAPISSLVVTVGIFFVADALGLRFLLIGTGVAVVVYGVWIARLLKGISFGSAAPGIRFRRNLLVYYCLNFVAGFRSQIFRTYVFILLVTEYAFPVERVAAVHLVGTVCGILGYRLIGRIAAQIGGARTLSMIYIVVALLFVGFANIGNGTILAALFLVDSFLFSTSVITDSHLRTLPKSELVLSDLGTGVTLFHAAGFVAPLLGGLAISVFDYQGAFYLGAAVVLVGAVLSQYLR